MDLRIVAIGFVIIGILIFCLRAEGFATAEEKADAVHRWFKANPQGNYSQYRSDLRRESNIVEYEDVRRLAHKKPNFTREDVLKIV